jgi:tRNA nucleotidyltransferase/poly(A) polymerase
MLTFPENVTHFMDVFRQNSYQIYAVGGSVRDVLLKRDTKNWDFTTNAKPEVIQKLFPDSFYHNTYGTVTVMVDEMPFEVTPFRKESGYADNRHPENIEWAETVEEDLARRDFTINAMASDGEKVIDLFEGQRHLEEKQIVAVGDPDKRFAEDALRLMRAVRFASQLGFFIEEKTRESIQKNAERIQHISWERIRDEFLKIIASDHPAEGVLFLKSTGLLKYILPEVDIAFTIPQKSPKRHHIYDVGTHLVKALEACPSKDTITRFATLIHDIGKVKTFRKDPETEMITFYNHEVVGTYQAKKIAERFRLSKKESEKLVRLVQYHQFTVSEDQSDKAVRRFIREVGKEYVQDMLDLRTGDRIGSGATPSSWRLELFKKRIEEVQHEPFKVTDLKVNGKDVMEILEISPGPKVGEILNTIFSHVEEGKLKNEREVLLKEIKNIAL